MHYQFKLINCKKIIKINYRNVIMHVIDNKAGVLDNEETVSWLFENRIQNAIKNNEKLTLKIATGFFFIEGLEKMYERLKELYEKQLLGKIEILMGPETKKTTKEALKEIQNNTFASSEFVEFLKHLHENGLIEIRVYTKKAFHVKLYIFKSGSTIDEVWAGSANLTVAGLNENVELVVSTGTNSDEKGVYDEFFNKLFSEGETDIGTLKIIEAISKGSSIGDYLYKYLEPRELIAYLIKCWDKGYLFGKTLSKSSNYLYEFQILSASIALNRLQKYGSCLLASSPGLGKTDVAASIANEYSKNGKILIIIPPILNEQWRTTLKRNNLEENDYKIISMGKLQNNSFNWEIEIGNIDKYSLIIVDEAHHFRNRNSNRAKNLEILLSQRKKGQHLLFITATPINTSLENLTTLIELMSRGEYASIFESYGITQQINKINKQVKENKLDKEVYNALKELLDKLVVRVNWIDIFEKFESDVARFKTEKFEEPEVKPIRYTYSDKIKKKIFENITDFLKDLNFEYAKLWEGKYSEDENLIFWYRWRLYKRLESSIEAFRYSIDRFKKRNEYLLDNLDNPKQKESDLFDKQRLRNIFTAYDSLRAESKKTVKENIKKDIELISKVLSDIKNLGLPENDSKIQKLVSLVESNIDKKTKRVTPMIIFSESKSTVLYIERELKKHKISAYPAYGGELEDEYGESLNEEETKEKRNKEKITEEFEAGKYDILVSTDILAEGVNLPRAKIIVNYDLPYNPVRLIQRSGRSLRINQIQKIKIYNFKPEKEIDKELELFRKLKGRIETIMNVVGLDFIIWSLGNAKKNINGLIDFEKLYSEYKEKLTSENPEKINEDLYSNLGSEDKILTKFIDWYKISKETVEQQPLRNYPVYTVLKAASNENKGYFILFKYGVNVTYSGELQYGEPVDDAKFTKEDSIVVENIKVKTIYNMEYNKLIYRPRYTKEDKEIIAELQKHGINPHKYYNHTKYSKEAKIKILKQIIDLTPTEDSRKLIISILNGNEQELLLDNSKVPNVLVVIKYV